MPHEPWTIERIERELREVHHNEPYLLTRRQLADRGKSVLAEKASQLGAEFWAARLNLRLQNNGRLPLLDWADAMAEAREVIAAEGRLPGINGLRAAGRRQLAHFLRQRAGSREQLLEAMGYGLEDIARLTRATRSRSSGWEVQRIRQELEEVCQGRDWFPTPTELRAIGKAALYAAVRREGGIAYWAEQMQLPRRPRSLGQ